MVGRRSLEVRTIRKGLVDRLPFEAARQAFRTARVRKPRKPTCGGSQPQQIRHVVIAIPEYFELETASPYMLMVAPVREDKRLSMTDEQERLFGIEKLNVPRSQIPAITHVDYSARIQTVHAETNPRYHKLISAFEQETGCPVIVNTSFNVRGEPIVCTPEDAYRCFMRTEMDYLVLENYILAKANQPRQEQNDDWKQEFELD